ncbi:MAG: alpha/beta hydrolase [Parvularculales bacterium]
MMKSLDEQMRALLDGLARDVEPVPEDVTPEIARHLYRERLKHFAADDVAIGRVEELEIEGPAGVIPARLYVPVAAGARSSAVVYYHGGGWSLGSLDTHDRIYRTLANDSGSRVIGVGYRRAPEHSFPAAVDDAYAAAVWVEDNASTLDIDPGRIAVAGDSSGGNLAAVVARRVRDMGGPRLAFQLLFYPSTDVVNRRASYETFSEGFYLDSQTMEWFVSQYLPDEKDRSDPAASPLLAEDLSNLPPACIVTASHDMLLDEGKAYADALKEAGVTVEYRVCEGLVHGFLFFQGAVAAAREGARDAALVLTDALR